MDVVDGVGELEERNQLDQTGQLELLELLDLQVQQHASQHSHAGPTSIDPKWIVYKHRAIAAALPQESEWDQAFLAVGVPRVIEFGLKLAFWCVVNPVAQEIAIGM